MRTSLSFALVLALALPASAQSKPEHDFDYLLGEWEFTASNIEFSNFRGLWSAVRLPDGQIMDEFRVAGDSGETYYASITIRNYSKAQNRWELITAEPNGGLRDFGTAQRVGDEIRIEQRLGTGSGQPSIWRIRYYNITKDKFSWIADRSNDEGKNWIQSYMSIEARRIGPPRSVPRLTRSQL